MNPNKYLYTVRDIRANKIGPIMQFENNAVAERAVRLGINADSMMARCPADFELLNIGQIDESTGNIVNTDVAQVALVTELVPHAD